MSNRFKAVIRLVSTIVLTVNALLTASGMNPIPFDETLFTEVATYIADGAIIVWTWFKDAPMTKIANKHHDEMVLEKQTEKGALGENFFDTVEEADQDAGSNL